MLTVVGSYYDPELKSGINFAVRASAVSAAALDYSVCIKSKDLALDDFGPEHKLYCDVYVGGKVVASYKTY